MQLKGLPQKALSVKFIIPQDAVSLALLPSTCNSSASWTKQDSSCDNIEEKLTSAQNEAETLDTICISSLIMLR